MLARFCDDRLDLRTASLNDEYFYQSLPLCVIDSVYSIGVRYESTRNTVARYCDHYGLRRIREDKMSFPERATQETVGEFLNKLESAGISFFVERVFRNRQRTSTGNGILKGEAVLRFTRCLHRYGIDWFQDVHKVIHNERFGIEIKSIPGQGSGLSLAYFFMLSGAEDLVKPDRWLIDFIREALKATCPQVTCLPSYAQKLLVGSCEILKVKYPHLSPKLLDNTIWNHQRNQEKPKSHQTALACVGDRPDRSGGLAVANSRIGPFDRSDMVLCSADAGPNAQKKHDDTAEYFFPGAKWVRAIGNSARRQNCRFVILTTAHGMVNPSKLISPYDLHIRDHKELVQRKWRETIPALLEGRGYRILIFHSGGCPRDPMIDIMLPILHDLGISLLSFGRPNMWDIGKMDDIVERLVQGTSLDELGSLLKVPDRLVYYTCSKRKESDMTNQSPFNEIWERIKSHEGEAFHTKNGLEFTYEIQGNAFCCSRTVYAIAKADFDKGYAHVPLDGPGEINRLVRGPAYVWAVLHDPRISLRAGNEG